MQHLTTACLFATLTAAYAAFDFSSSYSSPRLRSHTASGPLLTGQVVPQALADTYGAKCLDGSSPGFYMLAQDPKRWILFIEGGGWCFSISSCADRATGGGGSSAGLAGATMDVGGLLSPNATINPDFYNATMVFIHYCDGSSHSSSAVLPITSGGKMIWMRGRNNLAAVLARLLELGLGSASEVILSGGSAGGTSVFLALDWVRSKLPGTVKLVGAPDAGYFIDAPVADAPAKHAFRDSFIAADAFWNSTGSGSLNSDCLAAFPTEQWRCFFVENAVPYIKTPFHVMMSAYDLASLSMIIELPCLPPSCSPSQLAALLLFRYQFIGALASALESYPGNGAFIDSCLVHEQNVDYCSGQSLPNCRGWNLYNVTAPGYPAALTPQRGFSIWYDTTLANWDAVTSARMAWSVLVEESIPGGLRAYPTTPQANVSQVSIIDPLVWPNNPSCPYGT